MISNCGSDERGKYNGGQAGDQTGGEWNIRAWFNRPWNVILRHPDAKVREEIALLAEKAAKNTLVGYDQGQRGTYWQHLKASSYDPSKITVLCEADCSSGVLANVKAVGYRLGNAALKNVNQDGYTGNEKAILTKAGFQALTESKYLTSDQYLLRGDILLYEGHHTATNLTDGKNAKAKAKDYLEKGDSGAEVKTMQTMLIACGYSCGKSGADGDFGADTLTAVTKFQKENGLEVDGKYGAKSKAKLESMYKSKSSVKVDDAESFDKSLAGKYKVTAGDFLSLRAGAGTSKKELAKMQHNETAQCYGYYTVKDGVKWLYLQYKGIIGFASSNYLKK